MINYKVIPLGEIIFNDDFDHQLLENAFKKFSCQREIDLENFLLQKAIPYEKTNYGKTYLLIDTEKLKNKEFVVVAYFTIAQKSVDISVLSNKRKRKVLGDYPGRDRLKSVPAFLIGQLGRCDDYTSNQISGEQILDECYHVISEAAKIIGGNLVILECKEEMYGKCYEKKGYKKLYDESGDNGYFTLYLKVDFSEYWSRFLVN